MYKNVQAAGLCKKNIQKILGNRSDTQGPFA
jgi:hypothetical protein